jgi:hypothetical protein
MLNRRQVGVDLPRVAEHVVDMSDEAALERDSQQILAAHAVDSIFCTMGVGAPSKSDAATLLRVDLDLPAAVARGAKAAGASHFSLLTAVGADAGATEDRFFKTRAGGGLYNQVKGRIEKVVQDLDFPSAATFRPATLIGTANTPAFFGWLAPKLDGVMPAKFKSSHINTLAASMVAEAEAALQRGQGGVGRPAVVGWGERRRGKERRAGRTGGTTGRYSRAPTCGRRTRRCLSPTVFCRESSKKGGVLPPCSTLYVKTQYL